MKKQTTVKNGITAIYVRRSVSDKDKGNNSLSIAAQKEECVKFVGNSEYRIYCDDGKSGKDVQHRPAFMQMMSDAREGLICRIVVKKYDRFSRNMREYLNITDELDKYGVTVYSLSEPFNTETKEGRMMRNNLLNFAEFERETIAARVADAFNTKARETGFYQGGKVQFGYTPERRTINGKTGSVLVPSENAEAVRIAYELYQNPDMSLHKIIAYMREHNINVTRATPRTRNGISNMDRSHLSRILENPLYVRADKEVYAFFVSKGYEILDDNAAGTKRYRYLRDHGAYRKAGCVKKFLKIRPDEVESAVEQAMRDRIDQLVIAKHSADVPDADSEALRAEIIKIDEEIRKLMKKLADADTVLFEYIQNTVNELHEQKSALERKIQSKARKRKAIDTKPLEEPMKVWDSLSIPEKHDLAALMLEAVYVSDENGIEVKFSI